MNVTQGTRGRRIGIGELSRRSGVSVRTIRFYCDEGVLAAERTSGGHRVFDAVAVERLTMVRRLRGLGLALGVIVDVLDGGRAVTDAVGDARRVVDAELDALTRRRELLLAVEDPRRGYEAVVAFWRGIIGALPADMFDEFIAMHVPVPVPGAEADARRILALTDLVGSVADPGLRVAVSRQLWLAEPEEIRWPRALLVGLAEACAAVGGLLEAGVPPRPGPELDLLVAAHASARGVRDTVEFRRRLLSGGATDSDRRIQRYWQLTEEATGTVTAGAAQYWLYRALAEPFAGVAR
ncbi:MerR family transcriptional regulator [Nocardia sp. CDC160]|uniref:MerR family transcriptional regulator n=1 Tax=Nocardia sp. CDC160 TaxID=3112166 RepID=UPI002DB80B2D|nr:MerR family transcriptional regulator [Nocardia sp. CDC160]MEC3915938.1 MerR family transcriptional regulator [Nocardia sp. CDC160]